MKFRQLGLIGCGLMGASFALALKRAGLVERIVGYSASERSRARALELGVIDQAASSAVDAASGADLVLLAVPVSATSATLQAIAPVLAPDALLMDVGSTKSDVVAAARATLGARLPCFVPAHPITGKELAGIEHAEANLYADRLVILTPMEQTASSQTEHARAIWQAVGSKVQCLSPAEHDAAFAAVSHLPHLLAFAYINGLTTQAHGADHLALAGPGFRDFSRIAASDPTIWRDILQINRDEVLAQSRRFRQALDQLEAAMTQDDGATLQALITQASQARAGWRLGSAHTDQ